MPPLPILPLFPYGILTVQQCTFILCCIAEKVSDMVNTMLAIYQQQGRLPVWHLMGNETNTMPGNSATQLVADAYLKGVKGFDTALAYEAVKNTAMLDLRG